MKLAQRFVLLQLPLESSHDDLIPQQLVHQWTPTTSYYHLIRIYQDHFLVLGILMARHMKADAQAAQHRSGWMAKAALWTVIDSKQLGNLDREGSRATSSVSMYHNRTCAVTDLGRPRFCHSQVCSQVVVEGLYGLFS